MLIHQYYCLLIKSTAESAVSSLPSCTGPSNKTFYFFSHAYLHRVVKPLAIALTLFRDVIKKRTNCQAIYSIQDNSLERNSFYPC